MKEIIVKDGRFEIPERFHLNINKRRLRVRTAWSSKVQRLCKNNWTVSTNQWFRHKKLGEKPYVPEDEIHIDDEIFKAKVVTATIEKEA